ncbi:MAG TPA: MurT ligase domain-containing protein [Chloroflexota bacterium]|nr:MurT ligase domain-containing protein [Chloroflexota bacterium]
MPSQTESKNTLAERTRLILAVCAAKATAEAVRLAGRGGGTSVPGLVARRIDSGVLRKIVASSAARMVMVTGSNGKTTTCRMIAALAEGSGRSVVQNRTGSNLIQGVTAAAVKGADLLGRLRADTVILEIDEATVRNVAPDVTPDVAVVTNIFRDQLDRFGELHAVAEALRVAIHSLPDGATAVLNGDDPMVADLGSGAGCRRLYFGVTAEQVGAEVPEHAADTVRCPRCQHDLEYSRAYLSHLGAYRCPNCGFARPPLDVAVTSLRLGDGLMDLSLATPDGPLEVQLRLIGIHNAYNAAAAVAAGCALGLDPNRFGAALAGLRPAFGRLEQIKAGDRTAVLAFVKNPISYNTTLRSIAQAPGRKRFLAVHSNTDVDGEDFSWLWDVDLEELAPAVDMVVTSGTKAEEVAMRYKYAGVPEERISTIADVESALDAALAAAEPGGTVHILAGYTPMREIRQIMQRRKWVSAFWEE